MDKNTTSKMLDRYTAKGGNRETGMQLLADLMNAHKGWNLVTALVYCGFATEAKATKFAFGEIS